jgi:hypothetical protein
MLGFKYTIPILEFHMGEAKKKKDIIEPIWYIRHISNISIRNNRAIWELILSTFLTGLIMIPILTLITQYNQESYVALIFLGLIMIVFTIFYYISRKYVIESDIDIDRYSWVAYYFGRIGLELYRIGNMPEYKDDLIVQNNTLRYWLRFVAWDYHGDKSGKKNLIHKLKRNLKNLPEFVKDNRNNSTKLFGLGDSFLKLGENISREDPEIRINANYLNNLINYMPEGKVGILDKFLKILTHKRTVALIFILVGISVFLISRYIMHFDVQNSITYFVLAITALYSIYAVLTRD